MKMYRLRSTEKLLRGNPRELSEQAILFALPSAFNDPLEGNINMIYQGDSIVWENLFRHFLLCMEYKFVTAALHNTTKSSRPFELDFPIFLSEAELQIDSQWEQRFIDTKDYFLSDKDIQAFIQFLGGRNMLVSDEQLIFILYSIVNIALESIFYGHGKTGSQLHKWLWKKQKRLRKVGEHEEWLNTLRSSPDNDLANSFMATIEKTSGFLQQINLINYFKYIKTSKSEKLIDFGYLSCFFPTEFVTNLTRLACHDWCAASFMGKFPEKMSTWGHYANGHKGVCLIFNTEQNDDNSGMYIKMERPIDHPSAGEFKGGIPVFFQEN